MAKDELIPTRASLINRLKDLEDQKSWQDFYDIYSRLILKLAKKAGLSDAEAHDVLQETVVTVARHMPTFKYDPSLGSFKSWLFTMTRWRIADEFRKRDPALHNNPVTATATGTRAVEKVPDPAINGLDQLWNQEWENSLVQAAIQRVKRKIDPEKYQIFDLYVNKNWAPEKVATMFQVPVNQVYLAKHRIVEMIRNEVEALNQGLI
jgi:RNA polymerase sigma factor, sigma-70 family